MPHMIIYSDSHGHGLSRVLSGKLKHKFLVSGTVKPGTKIAQVLAGIDKAKWLCNVNVIVIVTVANNIIDTRHVTVFQWELFIWIGVGSTDPPCLTTCHIWSSSFEISSD